MKKPRFFSAGATISRRLFICFLVSTLIPMILITSLLCLRFDRKYRDTALTQMQISSGLIEEYLSSYFREVDVITSAPYYHSYFSSRESLDPEDPDYLQKLYAFQDEMHNLINLTTFSRSDISDFIIWSDGQYLYFPLIYNELWYFSRGFVVEEQPWYGYAIEANGEMVVSPFDPAAAEGGSIDTSSFFVARKIRNLRQPDQISLVIMNLSTKPFDAELQELQLLYDSFVVITNERDELIYSSRPIDAATLASVLADSNFTYEQSRWNSIPAEMDDFPLSVHVVFSLDDLSRHLRTMICSAAGIYLAGILLAIVLFFRFNQWISRSAGALQTTFAQLEGGDLDARCPPVDVREFNEIGTSINAMIAKLNEKIRNEYLMTIRQKNLQLYALQSQIQPHFLINTIYSFIALNQIGETKKLNAGFYSLAHLLRYVLSKEPHTTLGREADFLCDYLKLQRLRFGDRLSYEIDCSDSLRDIRIPRLLLQPLVENAIIHGIEPSEHPCLCRIRAVQDEGFLRIFVEDDGVGFDMAADRAEKTDGEGKNSVGLYYVRERMGMWSERAVLDIRCDKVTCAEIRIPWEEVRYESADR